MARNIEKILPQFAQIPAVVSSVFPHLDCLSILVVALSIPYKLHSTRSSFQGQITLWEWKKHLS